MNIKCTMLLLFLLAGAALPSETRSLPLRHHQRNLTKRSLSPIQSPKPQNLPRPVQSSLPLPRPRIPTSLRSTPVSSAKNAKTAPTPSEVKVEKFAQKLRDDLEAQERILNAYITTIQKKHTAVETNLKRVRGILSGLRNEIANATRVANQYQGEEQTQMTTANIVNSEYTKSRKMYEDEKANLKFEKEFLDAIIRYIKLRNRCVT